VGFPAVPQVDIHTLCSLHLPRKKYEGSVLITRTIPAKIDNKLHLPEATCYPTYPVKTSMMKVGTCLKTLQLQNKTAMKHQLLVRQNIRKKRKHKINGQNKYLAKAGRFLSGCSSSPPPPPSKLLLPLLILFDLSIDLVCLCIFSTPISHRTEGLQI